MERGGGGVGSNLPRGEEGYPFASIAIMTGISLTQFLEVKDITA